MSELILWAALAVLIALLALAVWAGRRGLHALGVVAPARAGFEHNAELKALVKELHRLNGNLERWIDRKEATNSVAAGATSSTSDAHSDEINGEEEKRDGR
ncbi:MAG: hypothetical protein AAF590_01635 [Pseudomonadota bacterium]